MAEARCSRHSAMDVPEGFSPTLILVLNLVGAFVFGLRGGLAAVRARLDLLGVAVLSAVVGLAGGITRDVLIGRPLGPSGTGAT
jgi:uncharacterized membrane protein YeiH